MYDSPSLTDCLVRHRIGLSILRSLLSLVTMISISISSVAMFSSALCAQTNKPVESERSPAVLDEAGFAKELERLQGICQRLGLARESQLMNQWSEQDTDAHLLYLPAEVDPLASDPATNELKKDANKFSAHTNWVKHFYAARQSHASHWVQLAKQLAASGDEYTAYRYLWRAAREDANHPEVKRVLGPLLVPLRTKAKARNSPLAHPQFGWPAGSYVRVDTANFQLLSRADTATTLALAADLERFYALWTQWFYPLWAAPNVTNAQLGGRSASWQTKREFRVILCKDRKDYLQVLGAGEDNIGVSVGYYSPENRMSFFYPDAQLRPTMFHELTHQLLSEGSQLKNGRTVGMEHDFWMVEGIALYMESLKDCGTHWQLGGWLSPRLQAARYRAIHDGYWKALPEFSAGGMTSWKSSEDIAVLYTQAAGLTHFFMDRRIPPSEQEQSVAEGTSSAVSSLDEDVDRNRKAGEESLADFDSESAKAAYFAGLVAVYQGDRPSNKLEEILGGENSQRDYLHFMLVRPRNFRSLSTSLATSLATAESVKELVLTRSQLTPEDWQGVSKLEDLIWLDISFTNAKPSDLAFLEKLTQLERLSLEGTAIDSTVLTKIKGMSRLKELDLSQTTIDDKALEALQGNSTIETLWLSGTKVTSTSLKILETMTRLNYVSLDETSVPTTEAQSFRERIEKRR